MRGIPLKRKKKSDNPKTTPYSVERNLLPKNQGSVSIFTEAREISDIFKEVHKELSYLGLLKKQKQSTRVLLQRICY